MSVVILSVWLLSVVSIGDVEAYMLDVFKEEAFSYTGGKYKDQEFKYRLFCPAGQRVGESYPIVIWLHGTGDKGDDNIGQLKWLDRIIVDPERSEDYPYFILALQCPTANPSWFRTINSGDDMLSVAMAALDKVEANYPIDPDRVYVSGISAGGTAAWELAMRFPNRITAVAPLSAGAVKLDHLQRIVSIPVWAFHSEDDRSLPLEDAQLAAEGLKALGGNVHLTVLAQGGHDSWTRAIRDYGVIDWLMKQRRNESNLINRPGVCPLPVYWSEAIAMIRDPYLTVPAGIAILAIWTIWRIASYRYRHSNALQVMEMPAVNWAESSES